MHNYRTELVIYVLLIVIFSINSQDISNLNPKNAPPCVDNSNNPQMCYPPFTSAAYLRNVDATNTCGKVGRQKYCVDLSNIDMSKRCQICEDNNDFLKHPPEYLTDESEQTWWQSETLAANKTIHNKMSVNLTLDLGTQFYVTYMYLKFKSPRPAAMIIYKKFDDSSDWTPWQYFSVNCWNYFRMKSMDNFYTMREPDKPYCTERYSAMNPYYDGDVIFSTIKGIPSSTDFFENRKLQDWTTASQIRIELKKMHTFGDENHAEKQTLFNYYFGIRKFTVGARCLCNGHGNKCLQTSADGVIQCQCHPLHYTKGQSCEMCIDGYNDRPWASATRSNPNPCKACNCNGNSNKCVFDKNLYQLSNYTSGGRCLDCQYNTEGVNCEKCKVTFTVDRANPKVCVPCNCNPMGSTNRFCDANGQCSCKSGVGGLKCDQCLPGFYGFSDVGCNSCQCNPDGTRNSGASCDTVSGQCDCKQNVAGKLCHRCLEGFFALKADNPLGCRPCFCFDKSDKCSSADNYEMYNITSDFIRSGNNWELYEGTYHLTETPVWNQENSFITLRFFDISHTQHAKSSFYAEAPLEYLSDIRNSYNQYLEVEVSFADYSGLMGLPQGSLQTNSLVQTLLNDVTIANQHARLNMTFSFRKSDSPPPRLLPDYQTTIYRFKITEDNPFLTSPPMPNSIFMGLLSGVSNIQIRLNYPRAYLRVHRVTLMSARLVPGASSSSISPRSRIDSIERCECPSSYIGDSCQECAPGFRRLVPDSGPFGVCVPCSCNNNADSCDPATGKCRCRNYSAGDSCEQCITGYYKSPTGECKKCPCPVKTNCTLYKMADGLMQPVCTDCPDNRDGMLCMTCKDNYFGNPSTGVRCKPCDCNNNINYNNLDNCDGITGICKRCIYNTHGNNCENCLPGYFGNARNNPVADCRPCNCNEYGTLLNPDGIRTCDLSGKCECKPYVQGLKCDKCYQNYYGLESGEGCKSCQCNGIGTLDMQCADNDGSCRCKPGVGGKTCDRCMMGYFNLTNQGCQPCNCDPDGSQNSTCNENGQCLCKTNVIGLKCDMCEENFHNISANCPQCPPCYSLIQKKFNKLYDVMKSLRDLLQIAMTDETTPINQNQVRLDLIRLRGELSTLENKAKDPNVGSTGVDPQMINKLKELLANCQQLVRQINPTLDYSINSQPSSKEIDSLVDEVNAYITKFSSDLDSFKRNVPNILQKVTQMITSIGQYDEKMKQTSDEAMQIANQLKESARNMSKELDRIEKSVAAAERNVSGLKPIFNSSATSQEKVRKMVKDFISEVEAVTDLVENVDLTTSLINMKANKLYQETKKLGVPEFIQELRELILRLQRTKSDSEKLLRSMKEAQKRMDVSELKNTLDQLEMGYNKEKLNLEKVKSNFQTLSGYNDRINAAQKRFDEAMALTKQIYKDLQNFESEIARTKSEAIEEWKKIPSIESDLDSVESQIRNRKGDVTSALNSAEAVSREAESTSRSIISQYEELEEIKMKSEEARDGIMKEKNFAEQLTEDLENLKIDSQIAINQFDDSKDDLDEDNSQNQLLTEKINNRKAEAQEILNNLQSINNRLNDLDELDRELEMNITNQLDNLTDSINRAHFENEHDLVAKHYEKAQQEFTEIQKLHKLYQLEINAVKQIDKFMYDGVKNGCFKIGATVEGKTVR